MSTNEGLGHQVPSPDRYYIRVLGGRLELDFPGRSIEPPTAPGLVGPLILLALHPQQVVPLEEFKSRLFGYDRDAVTTAQIQTPVSRLRVAGLPIPSRSYMLDVPPGAVDIVDFDTRAREFNDATAHLERVGDDEISALLEVGTRLHHLWRNDPAAAVRGHPRLSGLFDTHRGRHRRFGTRFVRFLLRSGEGDQAEDILDLYVERYPGDEALRGLEVELRRTSSRHIAIRVGEGAATLPSPAARSPALAEVRERLAATSTLPFAQLALGAHNFDRRYIVGRIALNFEETPILAEAESPGGAAPNTAVALARLGQRVTVAGIVADDHEGTVIRESLLEEGVDLSPLVTMRAGSDARTGRTLIVVDQGGVRLTGLDAGVNELLADVLQRDPDARGRLVEAACRSRIVNLTSFSGGKERKLQRDLLDEVREEVLVGFDPGGLYAPLGLDGLAAFTLRCDVLYVYEARLRLMIKNSSAGVSIGDRPSFETMLETLFRWRAARVDRPLVIVVKRPRQAEGQLDPSSEGYETITVAVGRRSVEELVSARAPASLGVRIVDNIGQGDAIAAAVHLGLLRGGPLDECANLASVLANEVVSAIGTRAGLPHRSTVRPAWAKYFPLVDLPPWVPAV